MAFVLCIGSDQNLMNTRKLILEREGHRVVLAMSATEVSRALERRTIDVAVLGQNLPATLKQELFDLVRAECPAAKVLELHGPHHRGILDEADDWLIVPADIPLELAEHVSALAVKQRGAGKD